MRWLQLAIVGTAALAVAGTVGHLFVVHVDETVGVVVAFALGYLGILLALCMSAE